MTVVRLCWCQITVVWTLRGSGRLIVLTAMVTERGSYILCCLLTSMESVSGTTGLCLGFVWACASRGKFCWSRAGWHGLLPGRLFLLLWPPSRFISAFCPCCRGESIWSRNWKEGHEGSAIVVDMEADYLNIYLARYRGTTPLYCCKKAHRRNFHISWFYFF